MIIFLSAFGVLLQGALALSRGIVEFTVIRMVQTGLVAAVIPLILSLFASQSKGGVMGFLNSARFAGNALGPILATSILAFSNLTGVFLIIGTISLFALVGFGVLFKAGVVIEFQESHP